MTAAAFAALCAEHDLLFTYSDDDRAYRRGREQYVAIVEAAKSLPPDVVKRIWDAEVDRKIVAGQREAYYWRYKVAA